MMEISLLRQRLEENWKFNDTFNESGLSPRDKGFNILSARVKSPINSTTISFK